MFNFGLSKFIYPSSRLIEYFKPFLENLAPECFGQIIIDETLEFKLKKELSKCTIDLHIKLLRITDIDSERLTIASPHFQISCNIYNEIKKSRIVYNVTIEEFENSDLLNKIYKNEVFHEFYTLNNLLDNWFVVTDNYAINTFGEVKDRERNQPLLCPINASFSNTEFGIYPAIIRYQDLNKLGIKRYDFCLFLSYKSIIEKTEDDNFEDSFFYFKDIKLISNSKEIRRKFKYAGILDINEDDRIVVFQSTEFNHEGIYWDIIENPIDEIEVEIFSNIYKIKCYQKQIELIRSSWLFYQELMKNHEHYDRIRKLD